MFEDKEEYKKAKAECKAKITKVIKVWSAEEATIHDVAFQEGTKLGFQLCAKSRLNTTTISDCPIKDEWSYVNNKLPKKGEYIWIYTNLKNLYIARLVHDNYFITVGGGFVQTSAVIAWREIETPEPPKEEKISI